MTPLEQLARLEELRTELTTKAGAYADRLEAEAESLREAALDVANAATLAELEAAIASAGRALDAHKPKVEQSMAMAYAPNAYEAHGAGTKNTIDNLARIHLALFNSGTELPEGDE